MLTVTGRFNCGELTIASPVPNSGQRAHISRVISLVVEMSASRLCMLRSVCTIRVLPDSAPHVESTSPGKDIAIAANGVLRLKGMAEDDYGLTNLKTMC